MAMQRVNVLSRTSRIRPSYASAAAFVSVTVVFSSMHHNEPPLGVHFDPAARRVLEQAAQFAFDNLHGPGSFAEVFGEKIGDEK